MKSIKAIVLMAVIAVCCVGITFADDDETHGDHEYSGHMSSFPSGIILLAGLVVAGVLVVTLIAKKKRNTNSKLKNIKKQETLEGQIMAMLTEYGGALKQDEIQKNLGLPSDLVSSTLLSLEKSRQITRDWKVENYRNTYRVNKLTKA